MANAQTVEILKVGHALVAGTRGDNGGAPSKDSIWGLARIQGNLVKFYGRRGGVLRYKTARKVDLELVLAQYESKLAGTDGKGIQYKDLTADEQAIVVPGLQDFVKKGFYTAMGKGKLNNRDTKKPAKVAPVADAATA